MKNQLKAFSGVLMFALAGQATAVTTWASSSNNYNPGLVSVTVGTTTATATGWADTGAGGVLQQQNGGATAGTSNFVAYSGGLGINNSDGCTPASGQTTCNGSDGAPGDPNDTSSVQPQHAIDNQARQEMVLLTFGKAINLTSLNIGWASGGDADFTVMAFNVNGAAGDPSLGTGSKTWNTVGAVGSGWTLIGDYQNSSTGPKTFANSYYSSYWLIGAYNPLVGIKAGFTADTTADYFKLSSVSGTVCTATSGNCGSSVPEPGSLALLGLGVMGVIRMRKALKA